MATNRMLRRPINNFIRNPNKFSHTSYRSFTKTCPYENTMKILEDPENDRTLYLIGTTHAQNTLAYRTKNLIEEIQPDSVVVQTSQEWAERAKILNVTTQKQMTELNSRFKDLLVHMDGSIQPREAIFKSRFIAWAFTINWLLSFPKDFHPFTPGLEMKFAVEAAEKADSKLTFLGTEFNEETMEAMSTEKRLQALGLLKNFIYKDQMLNYSDEFKNQFTVMGVSGGEGYSENLDDEQVNWWINYFERLSPHQKDILIDNKGRDIFDTIYNKTEGKKIVAVVNQWHIPLIQNAWKFNTNTEEVSEPINPIGDFDINSELEGNILADFYFKELSKRSKTEPATSEDNIVQFTDTTHEHERSRHVFFLGADDPHLNDYLWNDENKNVEYLSEEMKGNGHHH